MLHIVCNEIFALQYIYDDNNTDATMSEKNYERYYRLAGKASIENWNEIRRSRMCGCYYCGAIFPSSAVTDNDWAPDLHGKTVLCPECGIDAVIGDRSGIPIQKDVLDELYEHMFT